MARPVLRRASSGAAFFLAFVWIAGLALETHRGDAACSLPGLAGMTEARQKQAQDLQQHVRGGPFFKELRRRFGNPKECDMKLEGDTMTLNYAFRNHASLEARVNPAIEYSEQSAKVSGLNSKNAFTLLKAAAEDSFGPEGCGIDWNKPEEDALKNEPGSHTVLYRGQSCNCQGRIVYQGNSVVALSVSNSC